MPRPDQTSADHPDLELLLARATGVLGAGEAARVDTHVASCTLCRLEMARAGRFLDLERDEEAAAAADWDAAVPRLDAAWREEVRPAVAPRRPSARRWLVPASLAAAVALVAIGVGEWAQRPPRDAEIGVLRGTPAPPPALLAEAPVGEQSVAPHSFAWKSDQEFETYALEVFTADLGTVLRLEGLSIPRADLSDSLWNLFAPDTTYFWFVEGRRELTRSEASPTVWFRITTR